MSIGTDELHVWRARLDAEGWPDATRLPAAERERAAALRGTELRRRWLTARWTLRGVLGRYLEREPSEIELVVGARGKPALADTATPLRFNLSHSGELALVAVTGEREVGVDVERIRPRHNLLALAHRALPAAETVRIEALPEEARLAAFHTAWTRREAVVKCFGTGLGAQPPREPVAVAALDAGPGYAAAVAIAGEAVPEPHYREARWQTLAP